MNMIKEKRLNQKNQDFNVFFAQKNSLGGNEEVVNPRKDMITQNKNTCK
jgi:hypothetical protein